MSGLLRCLLQRTRAFLGRKPLDDDLDAEMATHLEFAVEENLRRGMSAEEARRQALIRFGGIMQAKEQHRETRGLPWLDILGQDVRYTLRTLRRDSIFTIVAVLILALGIGANIAVFSVVNAILLRPLPFRNPDRLVRILEKDPKGGESSMTYSVDATREIQQRNHSFASVTGYFAFTGPDNFKLTGRSVPLPVTGLLVMTNFFQTLGVEPELGRLFTSEEGLQHARPVVLLSHAFWKSRFAANPSIIGQAVSFNNTPVTVIGVLPESFDFGSVFAPASKVDMFVPYIEEDFRHDGNDLALIARMKPGVTLGAAQAEADELFPTLDFDLTHPEYKPGYTGRIYGLKDYVSGRIRRSLIVLWCAVGLILLIVCVNLSSLLLARAASRSREFAMRTALGAGRGRLVRQLLTESLILSCAGSLAGLGIAFSLTTWLAHQGSIALPLLSSVRVDGRALLWTLFVAIAAATLFGLAPGLRISRVNLQEALKESGPSTSEGRKRDRLRSVLVVSEVALACVLLIGAGLLLRSFLRVLDVDLGFQPSQAAAISVDYDDGNSADKRSAIWQEVIRRVSMLPGVETAGISDNLPMSRNRSWGISAKGVLYHEGELQATFVYIVSPGYLRAIGMRLIEGRDISWDDSPKSQKVVIINETVAHRLWPGQDPIGRIASVSGTDARVIGVIADVHESSAENSAGWQMYLPATQFGPEGAQLVVRSKLPPSSLASGIMSTLRSINPGQPATEFRPIQGIVDHATSPRRFFVLLVGAFAALGLILASLGIYGVIAYSVTRQTQEIGIRMALGASRSRVQLGVILKTLWLALAGIAAGTVISLALARAIASLLFGTAPTDLLTYAGMALLLVAVALLAGYIPAFRASRINPLVALRGE
ncbi:ABC transporter permease [Paracidobacterium acidisoli]|uniref:Permease n=1 Tax=Paracidobacterium acidisoli TaxID=2303751 RepID=A0A372ISV5_9BACT|nr:ABC transporter permease [Paracidobacterium acidisoli]MBT9330797.1 ABC transporter permease [Paracidobacterium acidisoli]